MAVYLVGVAHTGLVVQLDVPVRLDDDLVGFAQDPFDLIVAPAGHAPHRGFRHVFVVA